MPSDKTKKPARRSKLGEPKRVTLRSYQVGFGDCFLLSIEYPKATRHVLIDFGSTALKKGAPDDQLVRIANDIAGRCKHGKEPLAVVATHRHKDHVSGFDPGAKGQLAGAIIRACKPTLVSQPWTEDPAAARDAESATGSSAGRNGRHAARLRGFTQRLLGMQRVGALAVSEVAALPDKNKLAARIRFLGDDALGNRAAVENLMTMSKQKEYLRFGSRTKLTGHLPGVKVDVLGPPDLKQTDAIRTQRKTDEDEFWHLLGIAGAASAASASGEAIHTPPKSPFAPAYQLDRAALPPSVRWFVRRADRQRTNELLQIVRVLDKAMNNTSLILLFQIAGLSLLFPGDAQIENWQYALRDAPNANAVRKALAKVRVYKVGHHGSLNATPQSLWELFAHRDTDPKGHDRLTSVMSTMPGKHGDSRRHTEVPRGTLVEALDDETNLVRTDKLKKNDLFSETSWRRSRSKWAREDDASPRHRTPS